MKKKKVLELTKLQKNNIKIFLSYTQIFLFIIVDFEFVNYLMIFEVSIVKRADKCYSYHSIGKHH